MKLNFKRFLAMSLLCAVGCGFSAIGNANSFSISEDVKAPTVALKQATDLGVLTHETASLQNLANKDAILIMSFGTTFRKPGQRQLMLLLILLKHSILIPKL